MWSFFHGLTTCQMSLILMCNPRFSMFETRYQCKTSYVVFERTDCFGLVWTSSPAANYLSSECFVTWWVSFRCDFMSTLTFYFSRSWRQLYAFQMIDMEQGPPLITRINFNPGRNYIHKVWDEVIYPFLRFDGWVVEVWSSNFEPY